MTQHNWNFWLLLTLLVLLIGFILSLDNHPAAWILFIIGVLLLIACLYIGTKPEK
jgi:uncharacterized membrane protein AbrB (regulator of aidB expression)